MCKVLVPFTDPDSAERAIRQLLREPEAGPLEVELLGIAEAPDLSSGRRYVSPSGAAFAARAKATCWMARLGPILEAAHVPYHTSIAVGEPQREIEAALHRSDIDRVLLPALAPRWPTATSAVTLVA